MDEIVTKNIEMEPSTNDELNNLRKDVETRNNNPEITKREGPLAYCKVHNGDSIPKIRDRLSKYPEFSYLSKPVYQNRVHGFNIDPRHLKPGMNLMVPLKIENREVEDNVFIGKSKIAINQMKNNPTYGDKIKTLVQRIGTSNLARVMAAFAKVETANGKPNIKIGNGCLYRYESTDMYSVSYYHIIPKSERAGGIALKNLKMTIGDTCNPINAGKLFLGFWCQAIPNITKLEQCLNPNKPGWFNSAAKIYNSGSRAYPNLLKTSYEYVKNVG